MTNYNYLDPNNKNAATGEVADIIDKTDIVPAEFQYDDKRMDEFLAFSQAYFELYGTRLRIAS